MRRRLVLLLFCVLPGLPATADLYRCEDTTAGVHFVDDPSRCANATKHVPSRGLATAASAPRRPAKRRAVVSLRELLPDAGEIGPEWVITREDAITQMEPDQQQMGILEIHARHYGRTEAGVTKVCTVELWRFASASQASAVEAEISFPGWSFEAKGALLVTLRGTRFQPGSPFQTGLFPECHALGALVGDL